MTLYGTLGFVGAPGRARTCDLLIRSQTLYPTELRVHGGNGKSDRQNSKSERGVKPGEVALTPL